MFINWIPRKIFKELDPYFFYLLQSQQNVSLKWVIWIKGLVKFKQTSENKGD